MRGVLILAALAFLAVEARFPDTQGFACSVQEDECFPCAGANQPFKCGCASGTCECDLNSLTEPFNRSMCDSFLYNASLKTHFVCRLPQTNIIPAGKSCTNDQQCDFNTAGQGVLSGGFCQFDVTGRSISLKKPFICGSVGWVGDNCTNVLGECRGSTPYTLSTCRSGKCWGGAAGDPCCLGDEFNVEASFNQPGKACGDYPNDFRIADLQSTRLQGCGVGLYCDAQSLGYSAQAGVCRPVVATSKPGAACIHTLPDTMQCGHGQLCSNANIMTLPFYLADGSKAFGPASNITDDAAYRAANGITDTRILNPSKGICVLQASLNQSMLCGTAVGSSSLCGTTEHGDLSCTGGICRFVSNSTACANSADCGYFGECSCTKDLSSKGGLCNGLLDVPSCVTELYALRSCAVLNETKGPTCPTFEFQGVPGWLLPSVMLDPSMRNCYASKCKRQFQDFACCRGVRKYCFIEELDVPGLVTGLIVFVIGVAVSVVILLELPQNYLGPVWLGICWWHMWPQDIIDFIDDRPLLFPKAGGFAQSVKDTFAPKKAQHIGGKCCAAPPPPPPKTY